MLVLLAWNTLVGLLALSVLVLLQGRGLARGVKTRLGRLNGLIYNLTDIILSGPVADNSDAV